MVTNNSTIVDMYWYVWYVSICSYLCEYEVVPAE